MFRDKIQRRLEEMERINPSENKHSQELSEMLKGQVHFLTRYLFEKLDDVLGTQIYYYKPAKLELGISYYTKHQLEGLVGKSFPVRLTNNMTRDRKTHWSNDHRYVTSLLEMLKGRFFPTHVLQFTPIGDEYELDFKPIQ